MPSPTRAPRSPDDAFRILTVCTGNICRSPQAEQLLRARLPRALPPAPGSIEVTSAGTMALDGDAMEASAEREAIRLGITDTAAHRARRLAPALVEHADLVVALAAEHRGAAVHALPQAHARAFTLIELTRVLELISEGQVPSRLEPLGADGIAAFLDRVVAQAAEVRALLTPRQRRRIDIDDPYGRSPAHYRRSADAVAEHVDRLAAALGSIAVGSAAGADTRG